jgi:hypothetical protein
MFSKQDLLESFPVVDEKDFGYYFFQHKLPKLVYEYCLKSAVDRDLLTVTEDTVDRNFAIKVVDQAPLDLSREKPTLYELSGNDYGFTHVLAVPSSYHSSLKGKLEPKRGNLFLCIPIFRCEFAGDESEAEFRDMISRMIPAFKWQRHMLPKLRVYFDNPATASGTAEDGVLMKVSTLVSEIENLNGVVSGFIEITNYKTKVVEILSPEVDVYTLIRDRSAEVTLSVDELKKEILAFAQE